MGADTNFAMQLAVALSSIDRAHAGEEALVYVLHDGFDEATRVRISTGAPTLTIEWIEADASRFCGIELAAPYRSLAVLYRFLLPEVLPETLRRVIYLDSDVLVQRSLRPLLEHSLGDALVGAVRDPVVPWFGAPYGPPWSEIGAAPDAPYFNSGVLLIPLDRWRSERVADRCFDFLRRQPFRYPDQDALNAVTAGRWFSLDPEWNVQPGHVCGTGSMPSLPTFQYVVAAADDLDRARRDPGVIHFAASAVQTRPWAPRCVHPLCEAWFSSLDRTEWNGWRPAASSRSLIRRVAGRVGRAVGVLLRG